MNRSRRNSKTNPVSYDPQRHVGGLIRLDPANYRGRSYVHWSMTVQGRAVGWLDPLHHAMMRELMTHALSRFKLICPAYCLMPDHGHFLWIGWSESSDQKKAVALLREGWSAALRRSGRELQKQPYDHVLRREECARGTFSTVAYYVLENPQRAGLVACWQSYPFLGAMVPGYPRLDPRDEDFWEKFWRIHEKLANSG